MIIIMLMSQVLREGMGGEESDEQLWQWQVNLGHCHADGGDDDKDHYDDVGGSYIINLGLKFPDHSVQWGLKDKLNWRLYKLIH